MPRLVKYIFVVSAAVLWYFLLFGETNVDDKGNSLDAAAAGEGNSFADTANHAESKPANGWGFGVVAADGLSTSQFEGREFHHYGSHIRRNLNHCWRRYDGYNLQNTVVNKKEQMKKPFGILCNFKCTWFFTVAFPSCEFIYDYKLSCHLFTSLPDCTAVKCTLLNYFT